MSHLINNMSKLEIFTLLFSVAALLLLWVAEKIDRNG